MQEIDIKKWDLPINPLRISTSVDKQLMEDFEAYHPSQIKVYEDFYSERIVYEYTRYLAGEKLESISVKYPKTWWDHFKQDVMPRWFTKKYPVQYETRKWDAYALLPKVTVPKEIHGGKVTITFIPKYNLQYTFK